MLLFRLGPPATAGGSHKMLVNQQRSMVLGLLLLLILSASSISGAAQQPARSPSDTVREFYNAMREKRFIDAFGMSIYKPAIEGLKPQEFEDLRSDFNKMADVI